MSGGDNSAKLVRLQIDDSEKIIGTHNRTGVYPMSWYSKLIWEFICSNYKAHKDSVATLYRDALKQTMANFMYLLWRFPEECPLCGDKFLEARLLSGHYECFNFSYEFNEKGEITARNPRHLTDRNQNETERYKRIAINSVYDYNYKKNRHVAKDLTKEESRALSALCRELNSTCDFEAAHNALVSLVESVEKRIISQL